MIFAATLCIACVQNFALVLHERYHERVPTTPSVNCVQNTEVDAPFLENLKKIRAERVLNVKHGRHVRNFDPYEGHRGALGKNPLQGVSSCSASLSSTGKSKKQFSQTPN